MKILTFDRLPKDSDTKAKVRVGYNDGEFKRFFVRFYDSELEADFVETCKAFQKNDITLEMELKDGTYMLKSPGNISTMDLSPWGMMFRKYLSLSHDIRVDKENGERFYPVTMSDNFIEPCARRLA